MLNSGGSGAVCAEMFLEVRSLTCKSTLKPHTAKAINPVDGHEGAILHPNLITPRVDHIENYAN